MNFVNMGHEGESAKDQGCHDKNACQDDSLPMETDNNNLLWAARVLEMVYNDDNLRVPNLKFMGTSPDIDTYTKVKGTEIEGSLRQRGKSRADLWAFAALTAVELGVQYHNSQCDVNDMTAYCGGNPDNDPCAAQLPLPKFKFGRKDCTSQCEEPNSFYGFCTPEKEVHPNPHGNGNSVTSFFRDNFQLTTKESIALMGAHTLGHANERISGFRHYPWATNYGKLMFNNDYFKFMVRPNGWRRARRQGMHKWDNDCDSD